MILLKEPPSSRLYPLRINPQLSRLKRIPLPPLRPTRVPGPIRIAPQSTLKIPSPIPRSPPNPSSDDDEERNSSILEALGALRRPAEAGVLLGFLVTANPLAALAASGGLMGGSDWSSSSSYDSSSSSSSSSSSWDSDDNIFDTCYSSSIAANPPQPVKVELTPFDKFMFGLGILFFGSIIFRHFSETEDQKTQSDASPKVTIYKIQVCLSGMKRTFQKDLDQIAKTADTSTREGMHYVMTETALALLRHPDCFNSAYSYVDVKQNIQDGKKRFNHFSVEERGKFDEETLVNVNNIKKHITTSQRLKGVDNQYVVITILVAAEGVHKLPAINGCADLKEALQKLGSIPSNKTLAVEVLWTPQKENDTLTESELHEDYPLLRPL